jgi:proteic killer suppression protein
MIVSLKGKLAEDILWRERCPKGFPADLFQRAKRKMQMIVAARDLTDLKVPPGNQLEGLGGDRKGQHSIRINDQWRVCFVWTDRGAENVEIVDYH